MEPNRRLARNQQQRVNVAALPVPKIGIEKRKKEKKDSDLGGFFKNAYTTTKDYYLECTNLQKYSWWGVISGIMMISIALILW